MGAHPPHSPDDERQPEAVEFGPGGYLPQRAADRARKIVLRERMALSWPVAALVAGLVVLGAGMAFLLSDGTPEQPFTPVLAFHELPQGGTATADVEGVEVLAVRAPSVVRVFLAPEQSVGWCAETNRLEGAQGAVWQLDGRRVGGQAASLRPLPAEVHDGTVYAAPSQPRAAMPPADRGEEPGCPPP